MRAWAHIMAERLLEMKIEPFGNRPFSAHVMMRASHSVRIATGLIGESVSTRTRQQALADTNDMLMLISLDGRIGVERGGEKLTVDVGDALLFGARDLVTFTIAAPVRLFLLRFPLKTLAKCGPLKKLALFQLINRQAADLKLLIRYCATLFEDAQVAMRPGAGMVVVEHVVDLIALVIGSPRDAEDVGAPRDDGARLYAIKADILRNLTEQRMSPKWIADRNGISSRQLYRLFEREGVSFAAFVLERRLESAHDMMLSPRFAALSIAEIAVQAGFNDVSYFNRRFRAKFTMTPSRVRSTAVYHGSGALAD
jgi:AraC-like DNA-binding protein